MSPSTLMSDLNVAPLRKPAAEHLVLEPGPCVPDLEPVVLHPGRCHIGSDPACEVYLPVPGVAPRHCVILVGPRRAVVKALSPLTWLNDGVLQEATLRPGDRLVVGPFEWHVQVRDVVERSSDHTPRTSVEEEFAIEALWKAAVTAAELRQASAAALAESEQLRQLGPEMPYSSDTDEPTADPQPDAIELRSPPEPPSSVIPGCDADLDGRIEEQRTHLAQLAQSLAAREHEITAREVDVRCRWDELQEALRSAQEQGRIVQSERAALAVEREQLSTGQKALQDAFDELERLRAEQRQQSANLQAEQSALEQSRAELQSRATELEARADELRRKSDECAVEEARLADWNRRLESWQQELAERRSELDAFEQAVRERERQLEERERNLNQSREQLDIEVEALNAQKQAFDAKAARSRTAFFTATARHAQKQALDAEAARLNTLETALEDDRRALLAEQAALAELRQCLELQQQELERERNNRSADADCEPHTQSGDEHAQNVMQAELERLQLEAEQLRAAWDELAQARESLEADREALRRQIQEFAAVRGQHSDTPSVSFEPEPVSANELNTEDPEPHDSDAGPAEALLDEVLEVSGRSELEVSAEDSTAGTEDEAVLTVRARLAEMFGLTEIPHPTRPEPSEPSSSEWPAETDAEPQAAEQADSGQVPVVADVPACDFPGEPSYEAEDSALSTDEAETPRDESIAAYMEQLLARSNAKIRVPQDLAVESTHVGSYQPHSSQVAPIADATDEPPPPVTPKCVDPEMKEAMRANLDSFRELANISARNAVAKHQSEMLQTTLRVKCMVLLSAIGLVFLLFVTDWLSAASFWPYTAAAALAAAVMAGDVIRTVLAISRWKSVEAAGEWQPEVEAPPTPE